MAPRPPLTPTPPESAGARVPLRTRSEVSEVSDASIRQSTASLIFVKLRKMIASDVQPTETILGAIAVAAHSLTGATGAAVAMPRDGVVVCVGRSGETAPEIGDRLNVDSGISGECLRTGVTMRCDDASRDFHVDAEVCRQLGLQSIAVVPLRGQQGRVGVLEAFSTQAYAFTEEKVEVLERLAGLAEAAWARGMVTAVASGEEVVAESKLAAGVEAPAEATGTGAAEVELAKVRAALAALRPGASPARRMFIYSVAAVVLVAVPLASVYGWKAWYRSSVMSRAHQPAATAPLAPSEIKSAATGAPTPPSGLHPRVRPGDSAAAKPATGVEIPDQVIRRQPRSADRGGANGDMQSGQIAKGDEVPQIVALRAVPADLEGALVAPPALPKLGAAISQGITGGILLRKVQPVYPPEARRMHVKGDVVIDAVVTADGQVDQLNVVSGNPLLTEAATDAVRRWRYKPYSLNGKPIPKPTRITISFIAPQ